MYYTDRSKHLMFLIFHGSVFLFWVFLNLSVYKRNHFLFAGAQSDSEIQTVNIPSESGERGYTSDSELYDTQSKHHRICHTELEVKPVPDNGSWLMVRFLITVCGVGKTSTCITLFSSIVEGIFTMFTS